ncbi:MAG: hypothetical protein ACK5PS_17520 [Desulfopila sp.]
MKRLLTLIFALVALSFTVPALAYDSETHSVYKVTTYNLGALLGDPGASKLSLQNYEPLLITNTTADILSAPRGKAGNIRGTTPVRSAKGFAIAAEYSATPQLAVQGVLGVTRKVQPATTFDANSSWEANLGLIYRFLDNLSYEVHFGYMEAGNVLKERSSYSDDESIIMVSNKLTLSF